MKTRAARERRARRRWGVLASFTMLAVSGYYAGTLYLRHHNRYPVYCNLGAALLVAAYLATVENRLRKHP